MGLVIRTLTLTVLGLTLGCASQPTYPPALPATGPAPPAVVVPQPPPPPPRNPAAELLPSTEEWALWRPQPVMQRVCRGRGTRRRCRTVPATAVDQANTSAVVKPRAVHTAYGGSIQTRYLYDLRGHKVYEIHTSPQEFTRLLLPPDERLAAKLALDPEAWEVSYGKTGAEGSRQELIAVRPVQAPQKGRDMLLFQSGLTLYLQFIAQERPGMLSVAWEMPPRPTTPPELPLDQQPPRFDASNAYAGYRLDMDNDATLTPPWLPTAVLDDGRNTLIKFTGTLEGARMPVVTGIQQTGKPALVQSRLYVRPEHGAWMYVQGLWPGLSLRDAAGLTVRIVRQVPPRVLAEVDHAR